MPVIDQQRVDEAANETTDRLRQTLPDVRTVRLPRLIAVVDATDGAAMAEAVEWVVLRRGQVYGWWV